MPVPGTGLRIGLDGVLGLIPGAGDLVGALLSSYVLREAARLGASRATLLRMAGNVGIEAVLGVVPVVGDLFDLTFRANRRNVELLRAHLESPRQRGRVDGGVVLLIVAVPIALWLATILAIVGLLRLLGSA